MKEWGNDGMLVIINTKNCSLAKELTATVKNRNNH